MEKLDELNRIIDLEKATIIRGSKPKDKPCILKVDSFKVAAGETVYIKGEPGTGKTVLLRTVQCQQKDKNTNIIYPPKRRQKYSEHTVFIGLQPTIFKQASVMKNILMAMPKSNTRVRHRALELLNEYNLDFRRNELTQGLSRSQLLKLEIVRSVLLIPTVVLIDDFDLLVQLAEADIFRSLIKKVVANGGCVIASGRKETDEFTALYQLQGRTLSSIETKSQLKTEITNNL